MGTPLVEPIENVSNEDQYICDLETEVEGLRAQVKTLQKQLKFKAPVAEDTNCCKAYKVIVKNFHNLLDEILPF